MMVREIEVVASCLDLCAQKSSQKSTRPRGAKDAVTFPGAIGRNNACVRADARQVAVGGERATAARRGVYRSGWRASVPTPAAAGSAPPYLGGRPIHVVPSVARR